MRNISKEYLLTNSAYSRLLSMQKRFIHGVLNPDEVFERMTNTVQNYAMVLFSKKLKMYFFTDDVFILLHVDSRFENYNISFPYVYFNNEGKEKMSFDPKEVGDMLFPGYHRIQNIEELLSIINE